MRPDGTRTSACHPHTGCVTCSDEAVPMLVVEVLEGASLAVCEDDAGARSEVMTDLVHPVAVGARLLVHAGAALLILGADPAFEVRS